ncbi:hypothetical protein Tco_0921243 [Tanacetum coccineum]
MPLSEHAAHWANYLGELVRELPLHHPSWCQVLPEEKAGVMARIGLCRSDDKFSQMLSQLESQPEIGGGSRSGGSGGCGDDEQGDDENDDEDGEDEDDS